MIIGGGDGTVLFVVEDMIKYGCSTDNITFGIIPLGTGNDFSNYMGWGWGSFFFICLSILFIKLIFIEFIRFGSIYL